MCQRRTTGLAGRDQQHATVLPVLADRQPRRAYQMAVIAVVPERTAEDVGFIGQGLAMAIPLFGTQLVKIIQRQPGPQLVIA